VIAVRIALALPCILVLAVPACGGSDETADVPREAGGDTDGRAEDGGGDADRDSTDDDVPDVAVEDVAGETDATPRNILERLAGVSGMTVIDRGGAGPYRHFELVYRQPVDHGDPDGPRFTQTMTLAHLSETAPLVLMTEGYRNMWRFDVAEVAVLLRANQLVVEHRFFGESRPAPADWTFLTIEQAAGDHHRIVEALRPIYTGPWISTGYSKGGMAAVYHRRFFPDDVDGTVPYVAPISFGAPDARYIDFIAAIGHPACRDALQAVQRETLLRRDTLLPRLDPASFARIGGAEAAFETVVLEVPFTFWQYLGESFCSSVPVVPGAGDDALFAFVDSSVGFASASDSEMEQFAPYYYQAHAELGYPDVARTHLADLLRTAVPSIEEGLPPIGAPDPPYDPAAMEDVASWLATAGRRLLFVYGEHDPWTTGAFDLGAAADSFSLVVPGGTHAFAISDLPAADRAAAFDALERWTGVAIASLPKGAIPCPRFARAPPAFLCLSR
jgi:hypothetical protein